MPVYTDSCLGRANGNDSILYHRYSKVTYVYRDGMMHFFISIRNDLSKVDLVAITEGPH